MARKIPTSAARACVEFGVRLIPARCFSEYVGTAETRLAEPSTSARDEDFIVQTRTGLDIWVFTRCFDGWNAQRVQGRDGARLVKSATIPHTAPTLPALIQAVFA